MTADAGPSVGFAYLGSPGGTSIALDSGSNVHVVAHDPSGADLRYSTNFDACLGGQILHGTAGDFIGEYPQIEVSPFDGSIHTIYWFIDGVTFVRSLRHAWRTGVFGSVWQFETVFPGSVTISTGPTSLAIDGTGRLHASFSYFPSGALAEVRYATSPGSGGWTSETVTQTSGPEDHSIAADSSGTPYIAMSFQPIVSGVSDDLYVFNRLGSGNWVNEVADQAGSRELGRLNATAIDQATGRIHVSHIDSSRSHLRYARKDPGGSWVVKLVDLDVGLNSVTAIGVDGSGNVHICYPNSAATDIKRLSGMP